MSDYQRIAQAIQYLHENLRQQPTLEQVAAHVGLSSAHFQRMFSRWAGVSPKRYLQTLTLEEAKILFKKGQPVLQVAGSLGLGSGSRIHDHFVTLEAVTPGEFKTGGTELLIQTGKHNTPFGQAFIAATERGICHLAFTDDDAQGELARLHKTWPNARIEPDQAATAPWIKALFETKPRQDRPLCLQVQGTNFQVQVWRALLAIPPGTWTSYGHLAETIGRPKAHRAVGTAVGANPIAFAIPCHRVIQTSGGLGGYRWGLPRKQAMHVWEAARSKKP